VTVIVRKDNVEIQKFSGPSRLLLGEGSYTVEGRNPRGQITSQSVDIKAGESTSVRLGFAVLDLEMEEFDPSQWARAGTWYARRGPARFALYSQPRPVGRISFTFKPPGRKMGVLGSQHVKWVVAFTNDKNYVLIDLDSKEIGRTLVTDGKEIDLPRVAHKI